MLTRTCKNISQRFFSSSTAVDSLEASNLRKLYSKRRVTASDVVHTVLKRISQAGHDNVWISRAGDSEMYACAKELDAAFEANPSDTLRRFPLFGIPFGVKDNIDVAGYATTAACPAFSYTAKQHATTVQKILQAGGIFVGKTNLDQFATGLVGVRSPYGVSRNPHNSEYIPGGSSSGSAVAVSSGLVSFALGTDTAGSGRVPAGLNNIVGLKPTLGTLSSTGLVPACRTLDTISVFALTTSDAYNVYQVARGYDSSDPYSRGAQQVAASVAAADARFSGRLNAANLQGLKIAVPQDSHLEFYGDHASGLRSSFLAAVEHMSSLGATVTRIDFSAFREMARLLYEGPWLAERYAALREFLPQHSQDMWPLTHQIISQAEKFTAVDTFRALYRRQQLLADAQHVWQANDVLLVPTLSVMPRVQQVQQDPLAINSQLGYYTNFTNLMDLCGLSVPYGGLPEVHMPTGVTLLAPAHHDHILQHIGHIWQQSSAIVPGAPAASGSPPSFEVAVVGAHLSGMPLNHELTQLGARLVRTTRTAPNYRLFALDRSAQKLPNVPGLVHTSHGESGTNVEVEVWSLPAEHWGTFFQNVKSPLAIGNLKLEDGQMVKGFVCESYVTQQNTATDISKFGGWRNFIKSLQK